MLTVPLNNAIYFPVYEKMKDISRTKFKFKDNSFQVFALSAVVSGFITQLILLPCWVSILFYLFFFNLSRLLEPELLLKYSEMDIKMLRVLRRENLVILRMG